jgi:hypothetical protein
MTDNSDTELLLGKYSLENSSLSFMLTSNLYD